MNTTMSVKLPTDTLLKLIEKLRRRGGSQDLSEAMTQAIECWLSDPAKFEPGADLSGLHGYQWKSLFLPEGTVLKTWSYGENNYARVEGDQIIHNGHALVPVPAAVPPLPAASAPASPAPQAAPAATAPARNTDREPGWDLPERRKFRYRLEDVAY